MMETKKCPHCGASLPADAAFCPICAESLNDRSTLTPSRRPIRRRTLYAIVAALLVCTLALALWFRSRPKVYDGMGEVIYTD